MSRHILGRLSLVYTVRLRLSVPIIWLNTVKVLTMTIKLSLFHMSRAHTRLDVRPVKIQISLYISAETSLSI